MIYLALFVFVFVCVSSIFFPALRKFALALLTTAALIVGGFLLLIEIFH